MAYTICAIVYNMLVTVLCWRVYKSRLSAQKISLLSLYQYCILTLFIGLIELLIGIASIGHLYGLFLVYGILKILNVLLLLKKFEAIMQRVRGFWKYILCYWGIFTYFYCFVNYGFTNWFICINSLTLMPQIIHNVITCNKIGPQWSFLAVICSNQMYFIYVRGCPDNKLAYAPKPLLCYFVIIMLCLQLIIILMQNVYGPVFICKKYLLPEYHNYYE